MRPHLSTAQTHARRCGPCASLLLSVSLLCAIAARAQTVLTWSSGDILNVTTGLGATLSVPTLTSDYTINVATTGSHTFDGRAVVNQTTANWSAGNLLASGGATFTNASGGIVNDSSTGTFGGTGTAGATMTFTNAAGANYNVSATKSIPVTFTNDGTLTVSAGTLSLSGGGSSAGTINTSASGATVQFTNSFSVPDLATLTGTGTFALTSGTLSTGGTLGIGTFNQSGGTFAGTNTIGNGTTFNWSGGNWNSGGTTTIASTGILNLSSGSSHDFNGHVIVNDGTINWSGSGGFAASGGATLTNNGTFNDSSTGIFNGTGTSGANLTFTNSATGIYNKQSAGTKDTTVSFTNAGTVNVDVGILQFNGGGSSAGTIDADAGTTVRFTTNYSVPDASKLVGAGTYELTSGTLSTGGSLNVTTFNQTSGTLSTTSPLALTKTFNWSGGNWNSGGTTTIASTGILNLSSGSSHDFNGHVIVNDGTINWSGSGGFAASGGATLTNNGTFNDSSTGIFNGTGTSGANLTFTNSAGANYNVSVSKSLPVSFTNAGTLTVSAGTLNLSGGGSNSGAIAVSAAGATVQFSNNFSLASTSTLTGAGNFSLTGGTLSLDAGTVSFPNLTLNGGTLAGAGTPTIANLTHANGSIASNTFTLTGTGSTWTGGNWNGTAGSTASIAAGAVLGLSLVGDQHYYDYRLVTNDGTVNWSSGYIRGGHGGGFVNNAAWNDSNAASNFFDNYYGGTASTFTNSTTGVYTKTGAGSVAFNTPFNNDGSVLVSAGTLSLNGGGATGGAGTFAVASGATLNFGGGTSTLASGTALSGAGTFGLSGGTLSITAGTASLSNLTVNGGTLVGTGTATIGNLALSSGSIGINAFSLNGPASTWTGGNWNGPAGSTASIAAGAILGISLVGDHHYYDYRLVTNDGTVNWSGGYIRGGHGGGFVNNATWNDSNASGVAFDNYYGSTSPTFTNSATGIYTKTGAGNVAFNTPFNNDGSVLVQAGTLALNGGGNSATSGSFSVSSGTTLNFGGGTSTLASGTSLSGQGTFGLSGGTLSIASGTANISNLTVNGGTLAGAGTASIGNLTLSSGSIGITTFTLTGTGSTWTGGNWNGAAGSTASIAPGAILGLSLVGDHHYYDYRLVTNDGTVNWSSGYIRGGHGSGFVNNGTWNDSNAATVAFDNYYGGTAPSFTNGATGTYTKTGAATVYFYGPFNNDGNVLIKAGTLVLNGGGNSAASGSFNVNPGATLQFNSDYTIGAGATFALGGNVQLASGALTLSGPLRVNTFSQTGGTLAGVGSIDGRYDWSGGTWNTAANSGLTTTIAPGAVLNLSSANDTTRDFYGRALVNQGITNWTSAYLRGGQGSSFTNAAGGTFNDLNASSYTVHNPGWGGSFVFSNAGTYVRKVGGTTAFDTTFNNSGTIKLSGGDIQIRQGGTMSATSMVKAEAGTHFYFTNNYTLLDGAQFTGPGLVNQTAGTLTLDGTLRASNFLWSGGNWSAAANSGLTTTIAAGTTLNLTYANDTTRDFYGRGIVNNGVVNWTNAYLRGGQGSSFTNAAGGVFNDFNASGYSVYNPSWGGTFVFTNDGTYIRNAGGTTYFDTTFNNNGSVQLQRGDLQIRQGGAMSATGNLLAAPGTNVYFTGNTFTVANAASLSGSGTYWLTGATLDLSGTLAAGSFNQTAGTLAGQNTIGGTYAWSGGVWSAAANSGLTTTIAASGTLNLTNTSDSYRDLYGRGIVNQGIVNWTNAYIRGGQGSSFTNAAGGVFNDFNASGYSVHNPSWGGTFVFTNNGTYIRNAGGTTTFDVPFNNTGTLAVQAGDLRLQQGGTMSATSVAQTGPGGRLYFTNDYTVVDGARFKGDGVFNQIAGTLTLNGSLRASSFLWSGGNWNAAANSGLTTTIAAGTTLNLTNANDSYRDFSGRGIVNEGIVNWSNAYLRGGQGSSFTNAVGGVFNDFNASGYSVHNPSLGGTFVFTNDGTYIRNAGNTTTFNTTFNNTGILQLLGGDIQIHQGGTMSATSVVQAAVGTHLYFTNNYTLADGARFTGAGSINQTAGTLTLNGSLRASAFLWSGGDWSAAANSGLTTTIAAGTTLNLTNANDSYRDFSGRGIVNNGVVNWSSAYLRGGQGSSFTNAAGATFNDLNASSYTVHNPSWGGTFTNAGSYLRNATGSTSIDVPFTNTGTVRSAGGGTLSFNSTFTNTGGTLTAAGGNFVFANALNVGTGTIGGTGTFLTPSVTAGGVIAPGNSVGLLRVIGSPGNLTLLSTATAEFEIGGTTRGTQHDAIDATGTATLAGTLKLSFVNAGYAAVQNSDSLTLLLAGAVAGAFDNIAGGARLATSDGAGSFLVTLSGTALSLSQFQLDPSTYLWSGGTLGSVTPAALPANIVPVGGRLAIYSAADHTFNSQTLLNNGTIDWAGGYLRAGDGASLVNAAGGVFNDSASSHIDDPYAGTVLVFTNNGTYNKLATGTTYLDVPFNNNASVNVTAGEFRLANGGTNAAAGIFTTSLGATTTFASSYSLADGTQLTGGGVHQLTDGTLAISGSLTAGRLNFAGGTLAGTHTLHGLYDWSATSWNSGGTTSLASDATLNITGASDHNFNSRALANSGVVNWQAGYLRAGDGATLTNASGGVFNDTASSHIDDPYAGNVLVVTNNGTYNKAAAGTTFMDVPFNNNATVNVTVGDFRLNNGGTNSPTGLFTTSLGATTTFNSSYSLAGGSQLAGPGLYQLYAGTLTISGSLTASRLNLAGGTLAGTHALHGLYEWSATSWNSGGTTSLASDATLNITGASDHNFNSRALANSGIINWQAGYLRAGDGATLTNAAGGVFNDTASSHIDDPYAGSVLVVTNNGTYNKLATGTTFLDVPFNNNAAVNVLAGEFRLNGGGGNSGTGVFATTQGASLTFNSSYTLADGSQLTGGGIHQLSNGTLTISGNLTASRLNLSGGVFAGTHTLHGIYDWSASNWNSGGITTIASDGLLAVTSSSDHNFNSRGIVNNGVVNWQAGYLRAGDGATFTNGAAGVFNDTASSHIDDPYAGTALVVTNNGTYNKLAAGITYLDVPFVNTATVNVAAGEFRLNGGGSNAGTGVFSTSLGATTLFNSSYTLANGSILSGAGAHQLTNGTLTITGSLTASLLSQTGGVLAGTHTLHGNYDWSAGNWNSGGVTTVATDGMLNLTSANDHNFNSRAIVNNGTVNWQGGYLRAGDGATFTNAASGVFNDSASSHIDDPYAGTVLTFTNNGTYNKLAAGLTSIDVPFVNNNGAIYVSAGTLRFASSFQQTAGTVAVSDGATVEFAGGLNLAAGTLTGNGTIQGNIANSGLLSPGSSPGQLNVTGNLTLASTSALLFELGGVSQGVNYDYLSVSGTAQLNGDLRLAFVNGFHSNATYSQTFMVLTASSLTGLFANVNNGQRLFTLDGYGTFVVNYGASSAFTALTNSVVLSEFIAVPEPSTWALMLTGVGALSVTAWRRRRR